MVHYRIRDIGIRRRKGLQQWGGEASCLLQSQMDPAPGLEVGYAGLSPGVLGSPNNSPLSHKPSVTKFPASYQVSEFLKSQEATKIAPSVKS